MKRILEQTGSVLCDAAAASYAAAAYAPEEDAYIRFTLEMRAAATSLPETEKARVIFDAIDVDRTGIIVRRELLSLLEVYGGGGDSERIADEHCADGVEANQSAGITFESK